MSHQQDNQYSVFSLAEFKKCREEISNIICPRLMQIFQECANHELATDSLITEIEKLCQKLQDQHFRVAFIGEFNTGKSTLINALIGENIQPVKAIASSSTITVLKHGEQQRIICGYKNGSEKEISLNEYQDLTTIPTEVVLQHRTNELANSNIDQIIFEHPNLEFCKNGVVLVDSPGLNEHPNRTAITQKLLENIDAVIFLTIALQALSETERDFLVRDIITQLNNGEKNQPANNLFLVVNKIDVLDCEKDRQDVSKLVEEFAYGNNPIIVGKNRLHFISAKEAIKAFTNTTENEYSKTFNYFTQSLEEFLISERGVVEINNCATKIRNKYIKTCLEIFEEKCESINSKIKDSETKKHELIKQIDELRARGVIIRTDAEKLMEEMIENVESKVKESWSDWVKANWWESQVSEKSKNWKSEKNIISNLKGVFEDYSTQFTEDLIKEIEKFIAVNINNKINDKCKILDIKLEKEIENFIKLLSDCDGLYPSLKYEDKSSAFNTDKFTLFVESLKSLKIVGFPMKELINVTIFPVIVTVINLSNFPFSQLLDEIIVIPVVSVISITLVLQKININFFNINEYIRNLGFEACQKEFKKDKVQQEIIDTIIKQIDAVIPKDIFQPRLNAIDKMIEEAIYNCEYYLKQHENEHKMLLQKCEIEKAFMNQKRQELEQVQNELEVIINKF